MGSIMFHPLWLDHTDPANWRRIEENHEMMQQLLRANKYLLDSHEETLGRINTAYNLMQEEKKLQNSMRNSEIEAAALKRELDVSKSNNERLQNELRSQRRDFQKDLDRQAETHHRQIDQLSGVFREVLQIILGEKRAFAGERQSSRNDMISNMKDILGDLDSRQKRSKKLG